MDVTTTLEGSYELVRIPDGEFMMGSPTSEEGRYDFEDRLHKVSVSVSFGRGITLETGMTRRAFAGEPAIELF